jgi:uncharacterized protein
MAVSIAEMNDALLAKEEKLRSLLAGYGTIAIAYSGGVDSTYLAAVAHEALGEKATLILGDSPSIPRAEVKEAVATAEDRGWNLTFVKTNELDNTDYAANDGARCYFCRTELFAEMQKYARENAIAVMAYGAIMDDLLDPTRLGHKAAQENEVVSPLQQAALSKDEIRTLSQRRGLPTWDKPSFACLSSRFPVGTPVTLDDLRKVECAEEVLRAFGFHQFRARHHGDLCRIELDAEGIERLADANLRESIVNGIKATGYTFATLDLQGYRTGSTAGSLE